eukprot:6199297-Pleurochrysis_carterae.AAC.2
MGRATTIARIARRARANTTTAKRIINRSRGQNARESVSIAISLGYRDKASCVRGFNARNVRSTQVGYASN